MQKRAWQKLLEVSSGDVCKLIVVTIIIVAVCVMMIPFAIFEDQ